ncbi:MAG: phosphoadenosine phosphosulfate reductase family protein [Pseudomonadales bacterium]|nr:phosphoadenosine phosphosulfate reductase family protein [Pseudomonadales bacterium]MCP5214074.1 phosphoadenosine phosphosulfate reductase family protein [Pseudomonadales bacterium]MCP5302721.1 phosphoadenosine phosphosulfate reductase family protein [Pseudomonadales bacterium]
MDNTLADLDLDKINTELAGKSAQEIIRWAIDLNRRTITTTTFGDHSAVLLHMVSRIQYNMKVLWIDTGYNSSATYRFANKMINELDLNIDVFTPLITTARLNVMMGGIPDVGDPLHEEFTEQVKLEPFKRATDTLKPEVWITGIRKDQTEFRQSLNIVTRSKEGFIKVAPLLNWSEAEMNEYLTKHDLPNEPDYFDPTKAQETRECGLHTRF